MEDPALAYLELRKTERSMIDFCSTLAYACVHSAYIIILRAHRFTVAYIHSCSHITAVCRQWR